MKETIKLIDKNVALKIAPNNEKLQEISSVLIGYWQNDIWDIADPFCDDIR